MKLEFYILTSPQGTFLTLQKWNTNKMIRGIATVCCLSKLALLVEGQVPTPEKPDFSRLWKGHALPLSLKNWGFDMKRLFRKVWQGSNIITGHQCVCGVEEADVVWLSLSLQKEAVSASTATQGLFGNQWLSKWKGWLNTRSTEWKCQKMLSVHYIGVNNRFNN